MNIHLINCETLRRPCKSESLLKQALEDLGHQVTDIPWDQVGPDLDTDLAVIRLMWDYVDRIEEVRAWLEKMKAAKFPVVNSIATIQWNLRKDYLLDLQKHGIEVPQSYVWEGKYLPNWKTLEETLGPAPFVFKPLISSGSRGTFLVQGDVSYSAAIDRMNKAPFIAQTFLREVRQGEVSLMIFGGQFSHAVRKIPQEGDFRVQKEYGGKVESYSPTTGEIQWGQNLVELVPGQPKIARVDYVLKEGRPILMELEVFEPELFFDLAPKSAAFLAKVLTT